jgi:hypothetical protein
MSEQVAFTHPWRLLASIVAFYSILGVVWWWAS